MASDDANHQHRSPRPIPCVFRAIEEICTGMVALRLNGVRVDNFRADHTASYHIRASTCATRHWTAPEKQKDAPISATSGQLRLLQRQSDAVQSLRQRPMRRHAHSTRLGLQPEHWCSSSTRPKTIARTPHEQGALRDLYPHVERTGAGAGFQLAPCLTRHLRGSSAEQSQRNLNADIIEIYPA